MKAIVQDNCGSPGSVAVRPLSQPLKGADRGVTVEVRNAYGRMAELTRAGWETAGTPSIAPPGAVSEAMQA